MLREATAKIAPLDASSLITQPLQRNHLVRFVQDKHPDVFWVKNPGPSTEHVDKCTRRANDDLLFDRLVALPGARNRKTSIDGGELANLLDHFEDLSSELSRGSEADCLGSIPVQTAL